MLLVFTLASGRRSCCETPFGKRARKEKRSSNGRDLDEFINWDERLIGPLPKFHTKSHARAGMMCVEWSLEMVTADSRRQHLRDGTSDSLIY